MLPASPCCVAQGLLDADGSLSKVFSRARFLVLDEADRLLEPSFADELRTVLSALPQQGRQTLLFSATMTKSLIKLQSAALKDAFVHRAYDGLRTADKLKEEYVFMPAKVRPASWACLNEYCWHVMELK